MLFWCCSRAFGACVKHAPPTYVKHSRLSNSSLSSALSPSSLSQPSETRASIDSEFVTCTCTTSPGLTRRGYVRSILLHSDLSSAGLCLHYHAVRPCPSLLSAFSSWFSSGLLGLSRHRNERLKVSSVTPIARFASHAEHLFLTLVHLDLLPRPGLQPSFS